MSWRPALALAVLLAAGCAGAKKREPVRPVGEQREQPDSPAEKGVPPRADRPRVPASPEALLAPGAVGEIQEALATRGLLGRYREGELDPPTSAAIRRFQAEEGLAETGMPDRKTIERLGLSPEAAYGR
jgi:peptidoglycan hydrolase-like protein with peptidoglycan-binding domain